MDGTVWDAVDKQRTEAIDSPPKSIDDFRGGFPERSYFERLYADAGSDGKRRVPLSYYTKACAWAADYPLVYRRVMGFLNPGSLDRFTFDEYVIKEFGCTRETLAKLIADGWFVPLVADRSSYNDRAQKAIEELFDDVDGRETVFEVEPRYLNVVDRALEALGAEEAETEPFEYHEDGDRLDIDATVEAWSEGREPWASLPDDDIDPIHGVDVHGNVRSYVTERAVKLRLLDEVYGVFNEADAAVDDIERRVSEFVDESDDDASDLVNFVYVLWNQYGAPSMYCDFTGSVDIGPDPSRTYLEYVRSELSRLLRGVAGELRPGENAIETNQIGIWERGDADVRALFRCAPDGTDNLRATKRLRVLGDRAQEFESFYEATRSRLADVTDDDATYDTYATIVDDHNARRSSLTRRVKRFLSDAEAEAEHPGARHIASGVGRALQVKSTAVTLIDLARHANVYDLVPMPEAAVTNFAGAALKAPDRTVDMEEDASMIGRRDVTSADIWRLPYGGDNPQMKKFRWIAEDTLVETFDPRP